MNKRMSDEVFAGFQHMEENPMAAMTSLEHVLWSGLKAERAKVKELEATVEHKDEEYTRLLRRDTENLIVSNERQKRVSELEAIIERVKAVPKSLTRLRFIRDTDEVQASMTADELGEYVTWGMVSRKIRLALNPK